MDPQLIKALVDALAASDLAELEYAAGGETLRLVKASAAGPAAAAAVPFRPLPASPATPAAAEAGIVPAPAFGIVHLHRSPGAPPLVAAGDAVAAGQVLCLIEAMKVFTELRADRDATVAAVLVATGQEVEAGQPLFRMR